MGAKGSKDSTKAQEAKLDISTVSMALDSHAKSRSNKDASAPNSVPPSHVYPLHKYSTGQQQLVNPSSVRFGASMDQNGNHFYPSSVGKNSLSSNTNAEDPNNNSVHYDKGTGSKVSLKGKLDKSSSHLTDSHFAVPDRATTPNPSHYSHQSVALERGDKMPRRENMGRKSGSVLVVFLFEVLSLVALAALAFLLRYTDTFSVIVRSFKCTDLSSIDQPKEPSFQEKIIFHATSASTFYLIFLLAPIGLILIFEILRQFILIGLAHSVSNDSVTQKKIGLPIALYIRRTVRFTGGFLFGSLMTSVLVDILKYQTGVLRPYFLHTCPAMPAHCNETNPPEISCSMDEAKDARTSFPSMTAGMTSYAAVFLILYLSFALPYRGVRFLRVWLILSIAVVFVLVFNARLNTNQNHVSDMVVGLLIGLFFALYIVFIHLNAFANRLSSSNFLGAKRQAAKDRINSVEGQMNGDGGQFDEVSHSNLFADDDKDWFWKNFHIPRVHTLRQSARNMWRRTDNYFSGRPAADQLSNNTPRANHKLSNAYINPAFNGRDDSILSNHLHQESRLAARDSFNSSHTNPARGNLRTFQANS